MSVIVLYIKLWSLKSLLKSPSKYVVALDYLYFLPRLGNSTTLDNVVIDDVIGKYMINYDKKVILKWLYPEYLYFFPRVVFNYHII